MPISPDFSSRLLPLLDDLASTYGTPFHIYDAAGIVASHRALTSALGDGHRQYFAVKALPNPTILRLLLAEGSGLDCASATELELAKSAGAGAGDLVFTSNNTQDSEYRRALDAGALITFDDRSVFERAAVLPPTVSFRVSPHAGRPGSRLMGDAVHSKFGVPVGELPAVYRRALERGATHFGLHGMSCANELSADRAARAAADVLAVGAGLADHGIHLDHVNIGGGLGIPYRPDERPVDLHTWSRAVRAARDHWFPTRPPRLVTELGRIVTGPHGVLVSRVVNRSRKGHEIVGLDASMSALMRPALYGAYHHITLPFAAGRDNAVVDVVGGLCENMDKFAVDRTMPDPREGDIVLVHDTGAHGHAMGFSYNGRLRPPELLLTAEDEVLEVRRPETFDDYTATVCWTPAPVLRPAGVR